MDDILAVLIMARDSRCDLLPAGWALKAATDEALRRGWIEPSGEITAAGVEAIVNVYAQGTSMRQAPWLARHLTANQRAAAFFPEVGMRGDVSDLAQAFERHAEDVLWNSDLKENLRKAIMLLDCALPAFEAEARQERRDYDGGGLRPITCQERLKAVKEMIQKVGPTVGYDDAI